MSQTPLKRNNRNSVLVELEGHAPGAFRAQPVVLHLCDRLLSTNKSWPRLCRLFGHLRIDLEVKQPALA